VNRKLVPVIVVLAIFGAVAGGVALMRRRRLVIGVMLPLTGPDAPEGLGMRNGIQLAVDELNARGGLESKKVSLEIFDAPTPEKSVEGAREMVKSKVRAVEYGYDNETWMAPRPVLLEGGVIGLVPGFVGAETLTASSMPRELRLLPQASLEYSASAQYAWQIAGARKPLLVRESTQFGTIGLNHFRGGYSLVLKKKAGTPYETINRGDQSFPSVLDRYRNEHNDYVFFSGRPIEAALLIKELRAAGYAGPFELAGQGPTQRLLDLAKEQAEGAITVFPGVPTQDTDAGKAFLAAYAAHGFREPPGLYGMFAYATTQALLQAMGKSFLTIPSIWGALNHEEFDTAVGKTRFFNWSTSTYQAAVVYKVVNGQWKPIFTAEPIGPAPEGGGAREMGLTPYAPK